MRIQFLMLSKLLEKKWHWFLDLLGSVLHGKEKDFDILIGLTGEMVVDLKRKTGLKDLYYICWQQGDCIRLEVVIVNWNSTNFVYMYTIHGTKFITTIMSSLDQISSLSVVSDAVRTFNLWLLRASFLTYIPHYFRTSTFCAPEFGQGQHIFSTFQLILRDLPQRFRILISSGISLVKAEDPFWTGISFRDSWIVFYKRVEELFLALELHCSWNQYSN